MITNIPLITFFYIIKEKCNHIVWNVDSFTEKKKYTKKGITKTKGEQVILQNQKKDTRRNIKILEHFKAYINIWQQIT